MTPETNICFKLDRHPEFSSGSEILERAIYFGFNLCCSVQKIGDEMRAPDPLGAGLRRKDCV